MDITLIETMPLGAVDEDRTDQFLSLADVRRELESIWTLTELSDRTGGPARYVRVAETGGKLGFITPLTHNFCESCRRVRVTCTGTLYMCLGQDGSAVTCASRCAPRATTICSMPPSRAPWPPSPRRTISPCRCAVPLRPSRATCR